MIRVKDVGAVFRLRILGLDRIRVYVLPMKKITISQCSFFGRKQCLIWVHNYVITSKKTI